MRETAIQDQCLVWLVQQGWFAFRINNGAVYDPKRGIFRRHSRFKIKGVPDSCAMREGCVVWIEYKKPGGVMSTDQHAFRKQCEKHGVRYVCVESVEELQEEMSDE